MNAESKLLSVLCVAAGIVVLVITASMNLDFGQTIAATDRGKMIFAGAAIACDVIGIALFGILVGRLLKHRHFAAAIIPAIVVSCAVIWSIGSMIGFGATERMSVAAARQGAIDREARADKLQEGYLKWLRGTAISNARTKSQRRELLEAASAELSKVRKEASTEVRILPDAQAELLSKLTRQSVETVQVGLVTWLACLLILMKASLFSLAGFMWPQERRTEQISRHAEHFSDEMETDQEAEETEPSEDLSIVEESLAPKEAPVEEPKDITRARQVRQVRAFFQSEMRRDPNSAMDATAVYRLYASWCRETDQEPMKQALFGRHVGEIGIPKKNTGKNVVYRVCPVEEVPAGIAA